MTVVRASVWLYCYNGRINFKGINYRQTLKLLLLQLIFGTPVTIHEILFTKCSEKDEEPLQVQISGMHQKIIKAKERGTRLKQKVQILGSLNTTNQVGIQNGGYILM